MRDLASGWGLERDGPLACRPDGREAHWRGGTAGAAVIVTMCWPGATSGMLDPQAAACRGDCTPRGRASAASAACWWRGSGCMLTRAVGSCEWDGPSGYAIP